jgi:anti-anti-sigma factor
MPVITRETTVGSVTLLTLGGRLTTKSIGELHEKLQKLADTGRTALLLDCSQVTAIDSRGLGSLVRHSVSLERRGGTLKLLRLSPRMAEAFELTGLRKVFECFDDVSLALRSF